MNEQLLKYINDISYQDVKRIYDGFLRDSNPQAKAYWGRLLSAKRSGWNDNLAESFTQDIEALGRDRILSVLPSQTIKSLTPKNNPSVDMSPLLRPNKYGVTSDILNPVITPSSFNAGTDQVPTPEELESNPPIPTAENRPATNTKVNKPKENKKEPIDRSNIKLNDGSLLGTDPISLKEKDLNPIFKRKDKKTKKESFDSYDPEIKAALNKLKSSSLKSFQDQFSSMEKRLANTPSTDLAKRESLNYFLNDAKEAIAPIRGVFDLIQQNRELKQARNIADRSMIDAPSPPSVRGENRILSNLIMNSQVAYSNPAQMIQPYMDQVNLGYQQDLAQAQEMSGGQAGVAAGLGQAAAIRRNQANLATAPMLSDIYKQGLETTGALVGQQMQDDTWRDQQNIDIYKTLNTNNQELQRQAGLGLAASRARAIQARNNMWDSLLNSPVFDVNTYMNQTRESLINPPTLD